MKKYVVLTVVALLGFAQVGFAQLDPGNVALDIIPSPRASFNRDIGEGTTGVLVIQLQDRLRIDGYLIMPAGVATGYFGPATKAALIKYQIANGLPGTGYLGPLTRAKLNGGNTDKPLTVLTPNGGEEWIIGSVQRISWRIGTNFPWSAELAAPSFYEADIYLDPMITCAGGGCPPALTAPITLDKNVSLYGPYDWIAGTDIDNKPIKPGSYRVRVCQAGEFAICDSSNDSFSLVASAAPSVVVTSPNGAEEWEINSVEKITWKYGVGSGITAANVDLYLDGNTCESGPNIACPAIYFEPIVLDKNISGNSYEWIVGTDIVNNPIPARNYKLKICFANTNRCDLSDKAFTLVKETPIRVTTPNGDEEYRAGKTLTFRWNASDEVDHVTIFVGAIGSGCPTCSPPAPILELQNVRNSGSYKWKIPRNISGDYRFTVIGFDEDDNELGRDSGDSLFTIIAN